MSSFSQFVGGGKPKKVTRYTTGSGTYTPLAPNSWCFVTMIGGGGAGADAYTCYGTTYSTAGAPGTWIRQWIQVGASASYAVGTGATWNYVYREQYNDYVWQLTNATASTFSTLSAAGGGNGFSIGNNVGGYYTYDIRRIGQYNHGAAYGYGGVGTSSSNPSGCGNYNIGGNGQAGVIIVEEFGP